MSEALSEHKLLDAIKSVLANHSVRYEWALASDQHEAILTVLCRCLGGLNVDAASVADFDNLCRRIIESFGRSSSGSFESGGTADDSIAAQVTVIATSGYAPYSFLRLALQLRQDPDAQVWRLLFASLATLGAPDNNFVCSTFAYELAAQGAHQWALSWVARACAIVTKSLNTPWPERAPDQVARDIWVLGNLYSQAGDYHIFLKNHDIGLRFGLLQKLAHVDVPNFGFIADNISTGSDPFRIHPDFWVKKNDVSTHPNILNVLSYYLGMPFAQTKLENVPNHSVIDVFPSSLIDIPEGRFSGIRYPSPAPVLQQSGKIHILTKVRAYVDQWQTSVFSTRWGFMPELSHGHGALAYAADRLSLLRPDAHNLHEFDGTVAIVSKCSSWEWYSHWLHEILPMIGMLLDKGIHFDHLIAQNSDSPWCQQGFSALGISTDKIVSRKGFIYIAAERAIVPRAATSRTGNDPVSPYAYSFIRSLFLGSTRPATSERRIFISRRKARTRRLDNEAQLEELLHHRGFQILCLEDYSIHETARLLSEAAIVISTHGAGMANLCFCTPGTPIIELRPPSANFWIQLLCACFKLPYSCVDALPADVTKPADVYSDIIVDVGCVVQLLDHFGIGLRSELA